MRWTSAAGNTVWWAGPKGEKCLGSVTECATGQKWEAVSCTGEIRRFNDLEKAKTWIEHQAQIHNQYQPSHEENPTSPRTGSPSRTHRR